jgi:hypothetical protein
MDDVDLENSSENNLSNGNAVVFLYYNITILKDGPESNPVACHSSMLHCFNVASCTHYVVNYYSVLPAVQPYAYTARK